MLYFKHEKGVMEVDSENAYFMTDFPDLMCDLYLSQMHSSEVNAINYLKDSFSGKTEGKVFVDIGAHVGTYTFTLGQIFDKCFAFEPDVHTYNILCANLALHNMSYKCKAFNVAIADSEKDIIYKKMDKQGGNNYCINQNEKDRLESFYYYIEDTEEVKLTAIPLDMLQIQNIGLMKIDVEGFELEVLKGAKQTLINNSYPPIVIESWDVNENFTNERNKVILELKDELFTYLRSLNYYITPLDETCALYYCEHV
jgi:FkbM family methyltransferase